MSFSGNDTQESATIVTNDGWWPNLPVAEFQTLYRLPREYAEAMLVEGLKVGMAWANVQLVHWRLEQATEYAALSEVPASPLGDETVLQFQYRRAVCCRAKAWLLRQYPTINRRPAANNEARESSETESVFQEFAQQAIADFMGRGRVTVELI